MAVETASTKSPGWERVWWVLGIERSQSSQGTRDAGMK